MTILIPSWYRDDADLESDRLLNISILFKENEIKHNLLIVGYLPFLRYLANRYDLAYDSLIRVYDIIQNICSTEGHPLSIDDLGLPEQVERIYTPYRVYLYYSDKKYGEVNFNGYGWVSQVIYYLKEETLVDIYDDRGFVSSRIHKSLDGIDQRQDYFNEFGMHTLTEYFGDNARVVIEAAGTKLLVRRVYSSLPELLSEALNVLLARDDLGADRIIAATDPHLLSITKSVSEAKQIVRIISDDNDITQFSEENWQDVGIYSRCLATDTTFRQRDLFQKLQSLNSRLSIHLIPMFNIELNLGFSNSVAEQIIYWRLSELNKSTLAAHEELLMKVIKNTDYGMVISSTDEAIINKLEEEQQQTIDGYFNVDSESDDFKTVAHYYEAKKNSHLFNTDTMALQEVRKRNPNFKVIKAAVAAYNRIDTRVRPTISEIKKDFRTARLYVEFGAEESLMIQSLALSAGVPMIVKRPTDYVEQGMNGILVEESSELDKALTFFLEGLKNWNKSLVSSVELIEKNSSETILKKWEEVFDGA